MTRARRFRSQTTYAIRLGSPMIRARGFRNPMTFANRPRASGRYANMRHVRRDRSGRRRERLYRANPLHPNVLSATAA
jgi:hypothetical protein